MASDLTPPLDKNVQGEIAWRWEMLEEVDSTNRVAEDRVMRCWHAGKSAQGIVVVAARQTAGRGQHGRRWESPVGGLYMSMVIESVPESLRERLALIAGWAVLWVIQDLCKGTPIEVFPWLQIRWPNDVLLHDKKVAGILCEGIAQGDRWASIVGVGLNVKTDMSAFSPELRGKVTSLKAEGVPITNPAMIIAGVALHMSRCLKLATTHGLKPAITILSGHDALRDKPVRLTHSGEVIEGTGAGLGADGSLRVRLADGRVRSFSVGSLHIE